MGNSLSTLLRPVMKHIEMGPYTTREQVEEAKENRIEFSHLLKVAALSALGFYALQKGSAYLAQGTQFYQQMSPASRRSCDPADMTGTRRLLAFALGYFVNDTIATRSDWLSHPQDLLHHASGISIIIGTMTRHTVTEYIPRFFIVETSTVFLDIMWLLKEASLANSALYRATSILFASTFFLSRVVWLPLGLLEIAVNHRPKWKGLGIFRTGLIPVTGLQFYWFYRIVLMLTRK